MPGGNAVGGEWQHLAPIIEAAAVDLYCMALGSERNLRLLGENQPALWGGKTKQKHTRLNFKKQPSLLNPGLSSSISALTVLSH